MNDAPYAFDHTPRHDPSQLYRYRDGMAAVDLLVAALVHLDVPGALGEQAVPEPELFARLAVHARPGDVMITLLASLGVVERTPAGVRRTGLAREHLGTSAPWNLLPYHASMKDRPQVHDMLRVLRTGKPAMWRGDAANAWADAMKREDFARDFTAAMDSRGLLMAPRLAEAPELAGRSALLDIAGGSGIFACAVKHRHPALRTAVLEQTPVDAVTRRSVAERGFAGRVEVLTGDMFHDDWPRGFDAHLLSNVLHDWDETRCLDLLRRSHDALPDGGLLLVHDAFLRDDRSGPLEVAEYSALLMQITEGKCYSTAEMAGLLAATGFRVTGHHPTAVHRSVLTAIRL